HLASRQWPLRTCPRHASAGTWKASFVPRGRRQVRHRPPHIRRAVRHLQTSPLSLARTSRAEPESNHRPLVFGYGAKHLPDHLSGTVARVVLEIRRFARRSREHVPSVLSCFGEELFLDDQISGEPIEAVYDDAFRVVASEDSERVGKAGACLEPIRA